MTQPTDPACMTWLNLWGTVLVVGGVLAVWGYRMGVVAGRRDQWLHDHQGLMKAYSYLADGAHVPASPEESGLPLSPPTHRDGHRDNGKEGTGRKGQPGRDRQGTREEGTINQWNGHLIPDEWKDDD